MTRYLFPILFVLTLAAPFVLKLAIGSEKKDAAGARLRLVILTPHQPDIRNEFEFAFNRWHEAKYGESVDLDYRNVGGTGDMTKALADLYDSLRDEKGNLPSIEEADERTPYDIVWGGGDFEFEFTIERGIGALQPVELPEGVMEAAFPQPDIAGINLYDRDDDGIHWIGVCLSSFGIVYSPFVYDRLEQQHGTTLPPPQTWEDLTRPELAGLIALADPGKSGSAAVAYMMVLQRAIQDAEDAYVAGGGSIGDEGYQAALDAGWKQGMGDLLIIAAGAHHFTDSGSAPPAEVSSGNAAAGMAIDFYGRTEQEIVGDDRVQFVSPRAATAITPDPLAIAYGTTGEKLELANRFIEFTLTPEGQRLWILNVGEEAGPVERGLRRPPIRRDVYDDRAGWSDNVNPFEEAGGFNQRQDWMRQFSSVRMLWQAAWIESKEPLKAAYETVLAVDDDAKREQLLRQLRDLPVTWNDVRAIRAGRKASDPDKPEDRPAMIASLAELPVDHFDVARAQRDAEKGESLYMTRQRIYWANKFREHYAAVANAAAAG